jgi:hypothetical protein
MNGRENFIISRSIEESITLNPKRKSSLFGNYLIAVVVKKFNEEPIRKTDRRM